MQATTTFRGEDAAAPVLMRGWKPELTASIGAFISRIDSFYLGTADAPGSLTSSTAAARRDSCA